MQIIALLAMDEQLLIGKKNGLPWHIPEDLKRFKDLTLGNIVIMWKNTYFSLPEKVRPLPGRHNIVFSKDPIEGIETYQDIDTFLEKYWVGKVWKIFLIGWASLYNQFFQRDLVDQVELTLIHGNHDGDVYVDEFRENFFIEKSEPFDQGSFQTLIKKS